ncbi:FMP21-like protein [Pochonia chlamydosporia 170]|uniref:Succinate dehydrogenase assembly factor 4, mitochondrial n=1 Tax=Pochonia chlamydosporia 170 TaxID=1380566 RepID=A0A179FZ59_METCM|nr:FMP21-like protein [Pochonia chlamydosporia 170]OAQ70955.1 FMP21-like protein [Pochonia chlamydosporia 170]
MHRPTPLRTILFRARAHTRLSSFQHRPSPPKLPASQQAEFERLQRDAAVSSAFQPDTNAAEPQTQTATLAEEESVNPALFRGAKPEFEGDKNPKTGEVGGPKNEPLRWGGEGDWSYNGRVTDF